MLGFARCIVVVAAVDVDDVEAGFVLTVGGGGIVDANGGGVVVVRVAVVVIAVVARVLRRGRCWPRNLPENRIITETIKGDSS